jgi:NTP pyrophosphatase (non-canonical NTP hydrolase)
MHPHQYRAERIAVTAALVALMAQAPTDDQLVEFFNGDAAYRHFGHVGDVNRWTPRQTAEHFAGEAGSFNGLTPAEAERLALLSEELSEAGKAIGKVLRHGYDSHHPDFPGTTNRQDLERELGDVNAALHLMCQAEDLSAGGIQAATHRKLQRVAQYLHHQPGAH